MYVYVEYILQYEGYIHTYIRYIIVYGGYMYEYIGYVYEYIAHIPKHNYSFIIQIVFILTLYESSHSARNRGIRNGR